MTGASSSHVQELYDKYGFLLLTGLPRGSYLTLDAHAFRIDTSFQGFKMIPPGLHALAWQAAAKADDDHMEPMAAEGIRSILFVYIHENQVLARTYNASSDAWTLLPGTTPQAEIIVGREHLQAMDKQLAAYPMTARDSWTTLTKHLAQHPAILQRIFGLQSSDATCDSFTPVTIQESSVPLRHASKESTLLDQASTITHSLHCTPFVLARSWPPSAQGVERTTWSMDKSWLLQDVLHRAAEPGISPTYTPLLCEVELCFILFLYANNAAALEHWLSLLTLFACSASMLGAPGPHSMHPCEWDHTTTMPSPSAPALEAHIAWMHTLTTQFEALPSSIWTEELATSEARVLRDLAQLRANIARSLGAWAVSHPPATPSSTHERLVQAWRALSTTARTRFGWTLDQSVDEEIEADEWEEGDNAPVIVDTEIL